MGSVLFFVVAAPFVQTAAVDAAPRTVYTDTVSASFQQLSSSRITFAGDHVRLTVGGVTRIVATDRPTRLNPLFAQLASVSPDGTRLLYVTGNGENMRDTTFTAVNLATGQKRMIAALGNNFWIHAPRWSPDSTRILYVTENMSDFTPQIRIMNSDGSHQRLVTSGGALTHRSLEGKLDKAPNWSADGKSVIYYDSAYQPTTQWTVAIDSGARSYTNLSIAPKCPFIPSSRLTIQPKCTYPGCNVPIYAQNNQYYSGDLMYSARQSIGGYGCALTSLTMLFDYFGSTVGDARGMNNCLSPWGYADGLNWYGAQVNPPNGPGCDKYTTNFISLSGFSWSTLDSYLRSGWPVIVGICYDGSACNNTHFFVVVYGDGSDNEANYWINDPWNGVNVQMSTYAGDYLNVNVLYQKASGTGSPCE